MNQFVYGQILQNHFTSILLWFVISIIKGRLRFTDRLLVTDNDAMHVIHILFF